MRKLLLACCVLSAIAVSAEEAAEKSAAVQVQSENDNFANMGRGVVNLITCAGEVPRGMVYRNSEIPFWGLVGGAIEGVGLTGVRALSGVTDLIFLGFDRGSWFNDTTFCGYIWDSEWLPKEK